MRSIIFGVFQSLVVLLYILDNETNFVVQVSVFIGLLIDFWKITKVMDVRVRSSNEKLLYFVILFSMIRTALTQFLDIFFPPYLFSLTERIRLQEYSRD